MATNVSNPRKGFNFSIEIVTAFGSLNWLAQKVTPPDKDIDVVEHGDSNHSIKTGGRVNFNALTIEKLMTTSGPATYFWDWAKAVADSISGGGTIPSAYKAPILIKELAEDHASVLNTWTYVGCWPSKINGIPLDRLSSENSLEVIELQVDEVGKI